MAGIRLEGISARSEDMNQNQVTGKKFTDIKLYEDTMSDLADIVQLKFPIDPMAAFDWYNPNLVKVGKRILVEGGVKIGKTYFVAEHLAYKYKETHTCIYVTLNSVSVGKQEVEAFKEAGFANVVELSSKTNLSNKIDLKELVTVARTDTSQHATVAQLVQFIHGQGRGVILVIDEYDYHAIGVNEYTGIKGTWIWNLIVALNEDDILACISATHFQLLNMPLTFTKKLTIDPYKPNYRCLNPGTGHEWTSLHELQTVPDDCFELFCNTGKPTGSIKSYIEGASPFQKVGISISRYVTKGNNLTLDEIAEEVQKLGKKTYIVRGGIKNIIHTSKEYLEADVIIIGQPGGRALNLPNMKYFIYKVPRLLESIEQNTRISGYSKFTTMIISNSLGIKRIKEMQKLLKALAKEPNLHKMTLEQRLDFLKTIPISNLVEFFPEQKKGKTEKVFSGNQGFKPLSCLPFTKDLAKALNCIDEIYRTEQDGKGSVKFGAGGLGGALTTINTPYHLAHSHRKLGGRDLVLPENGIWPKQYEYPSGKKRGTPKGTLFFRGGYNIDSEGLPELYWQIGIDPGTFELQLHQYRTDINPEDPSNNVHHINPR